MSFANRCSLAPQRGHGLPSSSLERWSSSSAILAKNANSRSRVSFSVRYSRNSRLSSNAFKFFFPCSRALTASSSFCFLALCCFVQRSNFSENTLRASVVCCSSSTFFKISFCFERRLPSCSSIPAIPLTSHSSREFSLRYSSIAFKLLPALSRLSCSSRLSCRPFSIFAASFLQPALPVLTNFFCSARL